MSVKKPTPLDPALFCEKCLKPRNICVCERIVPIPTKTRVLILQHPQEDDVVLGTARLLSLSLPRATLRVGLSWASLEDALDGVVEASRVDRARWAVLFASKLPKEPPPLSPGQVLVVDRHGDVKKSPDLDGFVVLDGTWSQAKTLWWRNPWLLKLGRVLLRPREPSIYGKLRKAPRREWVSTLEAVAETLPALGEPAEARDALRKLLRTMVQRARDANLEEQTEKEPEAGEKRE